MNAISVEILLKEKLRSLLSIRMSVCLQYDTSFVIFVVRGVFLLLLHLCILRWLTLTLSFFDLWAFNGIGSRAAFRWLLLLRLWC